MDIVAVLADSFRTAFGPIAAAYALAAVGLNLHFGYTGLLNFGHVAFMMTGAYGVAVTVDQGGPLWLGFIVGVVGAVVLGLLFGLPTLRLRVEYLAIVTIAAGEVLRTLLRSGGESSLTRGVFGIQRFADDFFAANPFDRGSYGWGRFAYSERGLWVLVIGWSLVALVTLVVVQLARSPWGRVLRAIREDEDAARSLGKNVFVYKLQSLVIGGVLGALAGMLLAIDRQSVNPDTFLPVLTFAVFAIVILGGPGSRLGPVVGAIVYWFVIQFTDRFLREAIAVGWIPESVIDSTDVGAVRFVLVGAMLMGLIIWRPQGLLGRREEVLLDAD
ncbi:MAG TPA: branched-chain amino acid ABC transporter permease [Acidimicrobiales bacterium]